MSRRYGLAVLLIVAASLGPATGWGQDVNGDPAGVQTPTEARAAQVVSPEIMPDRRVTFRFSAPKASAVMLDFPAANPNPLPMVRDAAGVWSLTVGPFEPEIYSYSFRVDGNRVADPANPSPFYGVNLTRQQFEIPGSPPRFDELQAVPHGRVEILYYQSTVEGRQRAVYVYVPPGYDREPTRRYPVLYLYHGAGGSEANWATEGRQPIILDNLIAAGKAVPMIVVMPSNNVLIPYQGGATGSSKALGDELASDLIPFIEKTYRTAPGRFNRAIAGLSAGGGTAMNIGIVRLDLFGYVGEFSTGLFGGSGFAGYGTFDPDKITPGAYLKLTDPLQKPKLLFMSVGTEDPRFPFQKKALADFESHGMQPMFRAYPGVHEFKVWRHSLADFAGMLFR